MSEAREDEEGGGFEGRGGLDWAMIYDYDDDDNDIEPFVGCSRCEREKGKKASDG